LSSASKVLRNIHTPWSYSGGYLGHGPRIYHIDNLPPIQQFLRTAVEWTWWQTRKLVPPKLWQTRKLVPPKLGNTASALQTVGRSQLICSMPRSIESKLNANSANPCVWIVGGVTFITT